MKLVDDINALMKKKITEGNDYLVLEESFFYKYDERERMNFIEPLKNLGYRVFERQSVFGYDDYIITTDHNYKQSIFEYEF